MSILFVTVGTTALYNEKVGTAPHGRGKERAQLAAALSSYQAADDADKDRVETRHDLLTKLVKAHTTFWKQQKEYVSDVRHFKETSAELSSTHTLLTHPPRKFDRVVLLSSDTAAGWLATRVNQAVMESAWKLTNTDRRRIAGLDLKFIKTIETFGTLVREERRDGEEIVFNITGGFKGAVPAITLAAEKFNGEIYYQHESVADAVCVRFRENGTVEEEEWKPPSHGSRL